MSKCKHAPCSNLIFLAICQFDIINIYNFILWSTNRLYYIWHFYSKNATSKRPLPLSENNDVLHKLCKKKVYLWYAILQSFSNYGLRLSGKESQDTFSRVCNASQYFESCYFDKFKNEYIYYIGLISTTCILSTICGFVLV